MHRPEASLPLEERLDSALDRTLDGWGLLSMLLVLPAVGFTALTILLALAGILEGGRGDHSFSHATREFGPDLLVSAAGAAGAWVSVLLTGRRSRM